MVIPFDVEFESSSSIAAVMQAARAGKLGFKSAASYLKNCAEGTLRLRPFQ